MDILEKGKGPLERAYIETCKNCGCKFKYGESEVNKGSATVLKKYKNGRADFVNCPQCNNKIFVDNRGKSIDEITLRKNKHIAQISFFIELSVSIGLYIISHLLIPHLYILSVILFIGCIISLIQWIHYSIRIRVLRNTEKKSDEK